MDTELRKWWEDNIRGRLLSWQPLDFAARRGLPWVPDAIAEVVRLKPWSGGTWKIVEFMSRLSDCPADVKAGVAWLRDNAARLTWECQRQKRWVLP